MPSVLSAADLERDALRVAVRALGELAAGPARAKHEAVGSVLEEVVALAQCSGGVVAERVPTARGGGALRVLAACGGASELQVRGEELAREPALDGGIVLALEALGESLGEIVLLAPAGADAPSLRAALEPFAEACAVLLLGYERAAIRARAEDDLVRSQRHLRRGAQLDGLTGLATRAASQRALEDAVTRSHSAGLPLALILVDVDHAKLLAGRVGPAAFDEALARVARMVHDTVRPADWTGRWGVDAFVVALLGCHAEAASVVAERIRLRVEGASFPVWGGSEVTLSVSAGVASTGPLLEASEVLVARALRATEEAKSAGRNRVCVSRPARA
ncbi:MAG: GGDEF domain-containing protein [Deltaproteobacteria bacterium]|nr:GGDEF domain-containing protein [Deltaproteobacteria bacterium]